MGRYDDRRGTTRLYVGHLSSRTRSRDLDDIFSRYGSDPRDADDARYRLNGREIDGNRIVVEFSKGVPRGPGGSREYLGRGPTPGTGRCFNCGIDGHWARDCQAGDWKNKCYRCGERGHIEKNCTNSPKKIKRGRSYSRTPSPRRGRSRSFSVSSGRSYRSPVKRGRSIEAKDRRSKRSPPPSKARNHCSSPYERSPRGKRSPSPEDYKHANGSDYSPKERSRSRSRSFAADDVEHENSRGPAEENERGRSPSPIDDGANGGSPRGSESA